MSAIFLFTICTIVNVLLSTCRSLLTVKGGKLAAALMNCITYGFYTYVIVLTSSDILSTEMKVIITAAANFVCVYLVKFIEEKISHNKLWIFNATVKNPKSVENLIDTLKAARIKLIYNEVAENKLYTLQAFANNPKESEVIIALFKKNDLKYYAVESAVRP